MRLDAGWCVTLARGRRTSWGRSAARAKGEAAARRRTRAEARCLAEADEQRFTDGGAYPLDFTCYGNAKQPEPEARSIRRSRGRTCRAHAELRARAERDRQPSEQGIDMEMFWVVYNIPRPRRRLRRV